VINKPSVRRSVGRILEKVTGQSDRLQHTTEYGTRLLGRVEESQARRRVRVQLILTVSILVANLIGIGVALLLVTVAFPSPSVFTDAPLWLTFVAAPAYVVVALAVGAIWMTRRMVHMLRWAIEERIPTFTDQRNTFAAPRRLATMHLVLWEGGAALMTVLYGQVDSHFIPHYLFAFGLGGIIISAYVYLITEFALRPVAAQALEAGRPSGRFAAGIVSRTIGVWLFGSGVPVFGILLLGVSTLSFWHLTERQLASAVIISTAIVLVLGAVLTSILAWLTVTPVRAVNSALNRVEQGDFDCNLVVFDGTELGELQRGFNAMANGLREREHLRDVFGRHVGREVAQAAEGKQIQLGGEERYAAVLFVDIIGSTQLVAGTAPTAAVELLNRFFAVIVEEVDRHQGHLNKFEGDAALAVFGAPLALEHPESAALAAARSIASRLRDEVPECPAAIGVSAGQVVAGNVGAKERFEYTVIGDTVNEAARLCELAKSQPDRLLVSADMVWRTGRPERACWRVDGEVELRGREEPTRLAYSRPC
jgi:adenylate cyclase